MGLPALKTLRGNVPRGGDVHRGEIVPRGGNVPRGVMFLAGDVPRGVVVTAVWLSPRCGYPPRCGCSRGVVVLAVWLFSRWVVGGVGGGTRPYPCPACTYPYLRVHHTVHHQSRSGYVQNGGGSGEGSAIGLKASKRRGQQ